MILGVRCGKGRLHDFKLWKDSRWWLTPGSTLYWDQGFLGIDKLEAKSVLPFKASKKYPFTKDQKSTATLGCYKGARKAYESAVQDLQDRQGNL